MPLKRRFVPSRLKGSRAARIIIESGYTEGSEGKPCTFVCEICNPQNGGDAGQKPDGDAQEQCSCITLCTEGNTNPDCPVCGAENAGLALCKGEVTTAPPSNAEVVTVESIQAMIDALPGAEKITEDNAEEVRAQLDAIDKAKKKLSFACEKNFVKGEDGIVRYFSSTYRKKVQYITVPAEHIVVSIRANYACRSAQQYGWIYGAFLIF